MESYLNYLDEVLGIKNIFMNRESAHALEHQVVDILFVNIIKETHESLKEPSVRELFDKILAAMKIETLKVASIDYSGRSAESLYMDINQAFDSKFVIVMSREPMKSGELRIMGPSLWMEIFNPAYLLEHPGTKKLVWIDLQKVMKRLGV